MTKRYLCSFIVVILAAYELQRFLVPDLGYGLLFSVDMNRLPYSDPARSIVIQVIAQKAVILYSAPVRDLAMDVPGLFVCRGDTGEIKQIDVTLPDNSVPQMDSLPVLLHVSELDSLMISDSMSAPDGYQPSAFKIGQSYGITSQLVDPPDPLAGLQNGLSSFFIRSKRKEGNIRRCLEHLASSTDPIVHFIGWVIPQSERTK